MTKWVQRAAIVLLLCRKSIFPCHGALHLDKVSNHPEIWPDRFSHRIYGRPLFLRNISLGTFIDSGFATDHLSRDELLVDVGFELITGMELAWGFMADFRLGWPGR